MILPTGEIIIILKYNIHWKFNVIWYNIKKIDNLDSQI